MTQVLRYAAFASDPAGGNPAGVVLDADGLGAARMQQIAAEVGYSETAFLLRAGRTAPAFGLRFYSPLAEVAFCGHATVATSVALAEGGIPGPFRFETRAGTIEVSTAREAGNLRASLISVPGHSEPAPATVLREALTALRWSPADMHPAYPARVAFAGNRHLVLATRTRQRLANLHYDFPALKKLCEREDWTTLQLVWPADVPGDSEPHAPVFHARNPFPVGGVVEDPATGAAAAAFGAYLRDVRPPTRVTSLRIVQGQDMGRPSELRVTVDPDDPRITVSGTAVRIRS